MFLLKVVNEGNKLGKRIFHTTKYDPGNPQASHYDQEEENDLILCVHKAVVAAHAFGTDKNTFLHQLMRRLKCESLRHPAQRLWSK